MTIGVATLGDTGGICALFTGQITRWQRMNPDGRVEDLPYGDLSIYERWLHGGPWMSIETGALWLNHLLGSGGLAVIHENDGIKGYAEAFIGHEAEPYGDHLHIGQLIASTPATREALLDHVIQQAGGIGRVTVASTPYDDDTVRFYQRFGFKELVQIQQVHLSAQGANAGFYKVTPHHNVDPAQINEWQMPVGRTESARQHWEQLMVNLWHGIPEIMKRNTYRLRFNAGGQDSFVVVQEQLYNPRGAAIYCWTPKTLSTNLIGAIRDWSYKSGYRILTLAVNEKIAPVLDSEMEKTPHQQVILARDV